MKRFFGLAALVAAFFLASQPARPQLLPASLVAVIAGSGNVAAATATATLAGAPNKTTFLCGFSISGLGATAGVSATITITGLASGTQTGNFGVPAGVTVPVSQTLTFTPACHPGSGLNTAVVVSVASFGSGNTNASILAWGYQQ